MKHISLLLFVFVLLLGCAEDKDNTSPTAAETGLILKITGLPESLRAPRGAERSLEFTVIARTVKDEIAANRRVEFHLIGGEGLFEPAVATTDNLGRVVSQLTLTMPSTAGRIEVAAVSGNYSASAPVELIPQNLPARLILFCETPNLQLPLGTTGSIPLTAIVADSSGVGLEGAALTAWLEPVEEGGACFGALTYSGFSDKAGQMPITFNTGGGSGKVRVQCALNETGDNLPDLNAVQTLDVKFFSDLVRSFSLRASPSYLVISPDSVALVDLYATARDANRNGIAGIPVEFSAGIGSVEGTKITDANGLAHSRLLLNGEYGNAIVTAVIPGTSWRDTTHVVVESTEPEGWRLSIFAEPRFIYADNGLTVSNITAILKDNMNQSRSGEELIFAATAGAVYSPVITDALGRAQTIFTDVGLPSFPDSAIVTVFHRRSGIWASVSIMIGERNPVANIGLRSASQQMVAGRGDSTAVRATCFLRNDQPAPDGTQVHFMARLGSFTQWVTPVQDGFGAAETYYVAGRLVGTDTLQAWVDNGIERIYSNLVLIDLVPGPPNQIILSYSDSFITALVLDENGNPVRQGYVISFTTSLGTIQPSAVTDENGRAMVRLTPGTISGRALIEASYTPLRGDIIRAQIYVDFISAAPNSIELSADSLHLRPGGSVTLRARVCDANGNNVDNPTTVVFTLVNEPPPPPGATINNRWPGDSARTERGVAVATLCAGNQIGGKLIRAYTWRDSLRTDTVSVINSNVAVISGPP
ncbi:MAG: Ig-like domain-containing protein, partial [Calditrichota bacterium]